jgi:hypothetical protein
MQNYQIDNVPLPYSAAPPDGHALGGASAGLDTSAESGEADGPRRHRYLPPRPWTCIVARPRRAYVGLILPE